MATNYVTENDLGTSLVVNAGILDVRLQTSIVKDPATGALGINISALDVVSTDTGNLITVGADGGAVFNQAALQASETAFAATTNQAGFLTIAPAGVNGHTPSLNFDFTDATFVEAITDMVGSMVGAATDGLEFDDLSNTIMATLGNLTFGDGLSASGLTSVAVLADPASPSPVTVTAAGISVTPGISADAGNLASLGNDNKVNVPPAAVTALATEEICDLGGNVIAKAFAP